MIDDDSVDLMRCESENSDSFALLVMGVILVIGINNSCNSLPALSELLGFTFGHHASVDCPNWNYNCSLTGGGFCLGRNLFHYLGPR